MTPAIKLLQQRKLPHEVLPYEHDPSAAAYGLEAAEKLGEDPAIVFKTLVAQIDKQSLVVAIIPVAQRLNLKKLAKACNGKKAAMATPDDVQRSTGYVLGGVSPLGQKKRLPTVIHDSAKDLSRILVSGGKRGLDIALSPSVLSTETRGQYADLIDD